MWTCSFEIFDDNFNFVRVVVFLVALSLHIRYHNDDDQYQDTWITNNSASKRWWKLEYEDHHGLFNLQELHVFCCFFPIH